MKKLFFLVVVLISHFLAAQTANELFDNANTLYKEGKYLEAIELYKQIEAKDEVSSELYYNLGNAYYKLNKVAPTIYNYEKALQLNPLNQDVQNNLIFAKRLTLDRIEEVPKSFLQKFNASYLQKLSFNQWGVIALFFSFLSALFFLLFYFKENSSKKRGYFILSILSFIMLFSTLAIAFNQYNFSKTNRQAIVFSEEVEVKNAPTVNSEDSFTLHEGTKIIVLDEVDNWKKIRLADGKIGWLITDTIKEL